MLSNSLTLKLSNTMNFFIKSSNLSKSDYLDTKIFYKSIFTSVILLSGICFFAEILKIN